MPIERTIFISKEMVYTKLTRIGLPVIMFFSHNSNKKEAVREVLRDCARWRMLVRYGMHPEIARTIVKYDDNTAFQTWQALWNIDNRFD